MIIGITDVETTGLDCEKNEIIEIGFVSFDSETFEIIETFDIKVRPERPEEGDPRAYEVNGYNAEEWQNAVSLEEAMRQYVEKAKGSTFCAHNMIFDYGFLNAASRKTGVPLPFSRHKLDLLTLAWTKLHREIKAFSLKNLCEYLNIEPEPEMHRALNGAMAEYHVFRRIMQ